MSIRREWVGDEWENYCLELLSIKYGHGNLQRVPSGGFGDLGIEAYSRDGCAYQCYAPEDAPTAGKIYEKQRSKLTTDLGKLSKNSKALAALLGSQKISRYIFMVPSMDDRRIVAHATAKAEEVKARRLPFIAEEFFVQVVTDEVFPGERAQLAALAAIELRIDVPDVSEETVGQWSLENTGQIRVLDEKLEKVPTLATREKQFSMRSTLLSYYLSGEELLQRLRTEYPGTWEKVNREKLNKERFLAAANNLISESPERRLSRVIDEFKSDLSTRVKELGPYNAEPLAWHSAADWLLRCPLTFD